ncbi:MAG: helix-turn-helix transcriptional regulator [Bacteroidetes bacterium]|nr:helix-turn-helix transcriptional regulator [Bacteroidota bacterium]
MRRKIILPRILKVNRVNGLEVSVVFNNGQSRTIDFREVFDKTGIDEKSPAFVLVNPDEFSRFILQNNTLSWNNVEQFITMRDGQKKKVPFEIGADVLFQFSNPEESEAGIKIGHLIRDARIESGMTQQELAVISGTTRNYISRIENDRSDVELATLWKIIETGLGKHLEIKIKPAVPATRHRQAQKVTNQ